MKFELNGRTYMVDNWTDGYCLLPTGNYVMAEWADDPEAMNGRRAVRVFIVKPYLQPATFVVAKEI